jgi:hypothetical protein
MMDGLQVGQHPRRDESKVQEYEYIRQTRVRQAAISKSKVSQWIWTSSVGKCVEDGREDSEPQQAVVQLRGLAEEIYPRGECHAEDGRSRHTRLLWSEPPSSRGASVTQPFRRIRPATEVGIIVVQVRAELNRGTEERPRQLPVKRRAAASIRDYAWTKGCG